MRKAMEISETTSCLGRAHDKELLFVLLSRDAASPATIRFWVAERIRLGKNVETDEQIVSALEIAATMEKEFRLWTGPYPGLTLDEAERRYKQMCNEERDW